MANSRSLPVRLSPRPVRTLALRIARSEFAADLRADVPLVLILSLALLGLVVLMGLLQGLMVTPDGLVPIPTESPSCGDYCGTDVGLPAIP